MEKLKIRRQFTFKAYSANKSEVEKLEANKLATKHLGDFLLKSECHYYCEKGVLDFIKSDAKNLVDKVFLIYKISTAEDSNISDLLVEQILVVNNEIVIH